MKCLELNSIAADYQRIAVLSPHLDDAVLSLGGTLARLVEHGVNVLAITVLAGDPTATFPAGRYDLGCGFVTAGEAVRVRQAEDADACRRIGAEPVWLPFWDGYYSANGPSNSEIARELSAAITGVDLLLIPGYPLVHPDHAWLSTLVLSDLNTELPLGLYREQPYAMSQYFGSNMRMRSPLRGVLNGIRTRYRSTYHMTPVQLTRFFDGNPPSWISLSHSPRSWYAKQQAIGAYRTQLPMLGRLMRSRLSVFELLWGGEAIALWDAVPQS